MSFFILLLLFGGSEVPNTAVAEIRFVGNRAFSGRTLLGVLHVRPGVVVDQGVLDGEVRVLEEFYRSEGYFGVRVKGELTASRGKTLLKFYIAEGRPARVAGLSIQGNRAFSTTVLERQLPFAIGARFRLGLERAGAQSIRSFYLSSGYPFVTVEDSVEQEDTLVRVRYLVREGPYCYIKEVRVRGNRRVRTATLLKALEVRPGEVFSRRRLEEAQRRVYATKLFSRVLFYVLPGDSAKPGADRAIDSVIVRFDVAEAPERGLALGIGFETPPSRALFSIEWEHNNLLNRGQWLILGAGASPDLHGNYRANFDLTWRVPYLLWTRVDFQTHPFFYYERLDSARQREYGIESGMARDIIPQLRLGVFNRLRFVADTGPGITNSLALNLIYDSRDNFFDPRHGFYIQPGFEFAGGPLFGTNDFVRGVADVRWYRALFAGTVFAVRLMGARVVPYGRSQTVPYYEEFSLGGRNNLRGYPDRALGPDSASGGRYGPVLANSSFEFRGPYVFNRVGLVLFLDLGQVAGQRDITLRGFEAGAGVGVRVRTPVGPLRLDWGKRLKDAPPRDRGRLYFGVLHAF